MPCGDRGGAPSGLVVHLLSQPMTGSGRTSQAQWIVGRERPDGRGRPKHSHSHSPLTMRRIVSSSRQFQDAASTFEPSTQTSRR